MLKMESDGWLVVR